MKDILLKIINFCILPAMVLFFAGLLWWLIALIVLRLTKEVIIILPWSLVLLLFLNGCDYHKEPKTIDSAVQIIVTSANYRAIIYKIKIDSSVSCFIKDTGAMSCVKEN